VKRARLVVATHGVCSGESIQAVPAFVRASPGFHADDCLGSAAQSDDDGTWGSLDDCA
jgi:hypothetical protein